MSDGASRCMVIGIGNPDRGDDGAGRAVAKWLRGKLPKAVDLREHNGEATTLLACLEQVDTAYLIDACAAGTKPGSIHRFDVSHAPLPQEAFKLSTHGLGLAEAIELARALDQLPSRCIVYAIEGDSYEPGHTLTPAVAAAIAAAGAGLRDEIGASPTIGEQTHA